MKIGIVTTWFERGAAYVSRQFKEALEDQHDVFIFARGGESYAKGNSEWDGPEVHWGKRFYREATEVDLKEFGRWVKEKNIDIVLFNEQRWWPVVAYCNENDILNGCYVDYYTEESRPVFGLHDFLICNTKRHMEAFDWHPQAVYIPWGTDVDLFAPQTLSPLDEEKLIFFHSAGMAPKRKGTELVIDAFRMMKEKESKLLIHTQKKLTADFPEIDSVIKILESEGRLEIIQETVAAPGLYHKGDVYVYPSHLEGIGLTMAEALSCGLPLITVDVPPMNEFVFDGAGISVPAARLYARKDGYYWPKNDIDTQKLSESMDEYVRIRADFGSVKERARAAALEHLDWSKNSGLLSEAFSKLTPVPADSKKAAYTAMTDYENERKLGLKHYGRELFPGLYRIIRRLFKG
ncbi:MAG: glycosyltransferase family 4 protein [Spirochaetales bacterium]|nr:glycosyltransferase family 4 protein [Spirochaetales bacterium]